jgi:hypothetical protein
MVFRNNVRSDEKDIEGMVREYMENESFRKLSRKDQIYLTHEILSFSSNEDNKLITDELLADMVQQYISLRGEGGMYLGAVHRDRDHAHVHLAVSGLQYRIGKSFRLSKNELQELKIGLQEYHQKKYPELTESNCKHGLGKEYVTDRQWYAKHKESRAAVKGQLKEQVQQAFAQATSQKQFIELLREQNLHHYERGNAITGIMHEDQKFRFSRLDVDLEQLPQDRTEEELVLDEIHAIRERMVEERDYEFEDEYELIFKKRI